jgi:hypothetical protein
MDIDRRIGIRPRVLSVIERQARRIARTVSGPWVGRAEPALMSWFRSSQRGPRNQADTSINV